MRNPRRGGAARGHARGIAALVVAWLAAGWSLGGESREDWQQPDRVMADLHLKAGAHVADMGCGAGYFTFRLAQAVGPTGKVFAVDINPKALEPVRQRIARDRLAHVEVIQSEPTDAKLRPASCDAVLLCDVLHEMPPNDRLPLVRSIAQALKPAGYLFLIDYRKSRDVKFDPYEKLIPREDLVKLGTDAGLSLDAELHYLKYQVCLRFRKAAPPPKPGP